MSMAGSTARAGAARPAGAGIDFPRGWLHLEGALACSSFKQHALFEQVVVEGAPSRKASCVVLVKASRVAGEREREETAARTAERALIAGCMKGATVDWRCGTNDDGLASRRTSPGSPRAAPDPVPPAPRDREALGGTTPCPVSVSLTLSGQRRYGRYRASEMCCLDCIRHLRMRSPPPTAAMMRARRMIDAITCRELPSAAMGPPSRSAEALSRDNEAGAILLSNCRGGRSHRKHL